MNRTKFIEWKHINKYDGLPDAIDKQTVQTDIIDLLTQIDTAIARIEAIIDSTEKEPAPGGYTYTLDGAAIEEARVWVAGVVGDRE